MSKSKYARIVILSIIFIISSLCANAQTHAYFKKYKSLSHKLSSKYGIPASLILAIGFVESGGGTSKNSKVLKNHFGIAGKNNIGSRYKKFKTVEESFEAFCRLNSKKGYYKKLKNNKNHSEWLKAMAPTYTEHPSEWIRRVNLIIKKYKLSDL